MTDYVFKAMTRPPSMGGVTQGAIIFVIGTSILMLSVPMIFFRSLYGLPAGLIFGIVSFSACRILCESDINTFGYVAANIRFIMKCPGLRIGKVMRTYSPAPLRKR